MAKQSYVIIPVAGAIWSNTMPGKLAKYLPFLSDDERAALYGSIITAASKPLGDPTRDGVIQGWFFFTLCSLYYRLLTLRHIQPTTRR